ncbi:hypothetical protein OAD42_02760 [Oceanospirillaceae bacterium]|nr:hypothetical protein [Oceanospirillaceae bacterium]
MQLIQKLINYAIYSTTSWGRFLVAFWLAGKLKKYRLLKRYLKSRSNRIDNSDWLTCYASYRHEVLFGSYEKASVQRKKMNLTVFKCGFFENIIFCSQRKLDFESNRLVKDEVLFTLSRFRYVEGLMLGRFSLFSDGKKMVINDYLPPAINLVVLGSAPSVSFDDHKSRDNYYVVLNPSRKHKIIEDIEPNRLIAAFNGEAFNRILNSPDELKFLKSLPLVLVRSKKNFYEARSAGLKHIRVMTDARSLMVHDYGFNSIQNVVATLLEMRPSSIYITGSTLFLGKNLARKDYQPKGFDSLQRFFGMRYHDPIANFIFLDVLFRMNFIEADVTLREILNGGLLNYAESLDKQWGSYNLLDKENLC